MLKVLNSRIAQCFKHGVIFIFIGILVWSCASIKAPPGGPVDETAPEIINIFPSNGTVNLTERKIEIEFSEYMDENSFVNNIVVFPRLEFPLKLKFKGDKINLILPDKLDSTKTYIIQLNRNIKDEHGVPLAKPAQLAYSSGSRIDQGIISGKVFGAGNEVVHLWKTNDASADSIFGAIPDYVTDSDDNGEYSFEYLAPGNYNILAVEKSGADLALNVERTGYGVYWKNYILLAENDTVSGINMRMWKEPQDLKLVRGEWSNNSWGDIFFNNDLHDSIDLNMRLIQGEDFVQYDYYINSFDSKNITIYPLDSLFSESVQIKIDSISVENEIVLGSATLEIRIPQEADTSYLQIISPQSRYTITPNNISGENIDLHFSKPVILTSDTLLSPQLFDEDSIKLNIDISKVDPMYYIIKPIDPWIANAQYRLVLNREGVITDHGRGLQDSLVTIGINTTNRMGFGGVLGSVSESEQNNIIVELFAVKNPTLSHIADVNSKSQFEFKMIPEGEYSLRIFYDQNGDMNYSFGKAYPFQPSEWFYFYPDTFEVRANWDTELNPIILPEVKQ